MTPKELKNSILQLAIEGKLVKQRKEEGSAETLYAEIQKEKQKLIKQGKIKKEKELPEITDDEVPFEIPKSWKWVKFGEIVNYNMGKTPPRAESQWWGKGVPWVSIADMPENEHIKATKEFVTKEAIKNKFNDRVSKKGTLLMSFKLTVGRVSILDIDAVHNEAIISIYPLCDENNIMQKYLFYILPLVTNWGDSKDAIKGKTLNDTSIKNLLISLPPLAEQKCIVEKIEELMPLVDRYEVLYNRLNELNKEFPKKLKNAVLQKAIEGKLVPQIKSEGSAEDLYKEIQKEKQKLIKQGKIKKEKELPEITEDEVPFEIPKSWKWVKFGTISEIKSSKRVFQNDYTYSGIPFFRSKEIGDLCNGNEIRTELYISENHYNEIKKMYGVPFEGDILLTSVGTIGNVWICDKRKFYYKDGNIIQICKNEFVYNRFIKTFIESNIFLNQIINSVTGTAYSALTIIKLKNIIIPLPPLQEQKRIVEKIEEILPNIEKLVKHD